jgi:hypothetical protein
LAEFQQTTQLYIPEDGTLSFKAMLEVDKDDVLKMDMES